MNVKDKIISISKNKDAKVLVENFFYLSLLKIAGYVFPLISMPYLARVIGVNGFGKIAFATAVISWIQTVADWGFNFTATRDVAQNRDDRQKVSKIFSNVFWARCYLMVLSFVILVILICTIPKFNENSVIILVTFLLIPGHIFFPDWFFQAIEKMKYITILNVLTKLFFTIAIFLFVKKESDYILQPLFLSIGYLLSGIISLYYILIRWKIELLQPSIAEIKQTIKDSTDVFINNLMPNMYNSFSTMLLGFLGGSIANGKLDAGSKFVGILDQFVQVISRTFFPFLSRRIDKHQLYAKCSVYTSFFMSVLLFFISPLLISCFYTEEFRDSVVVLKIMSISVFFLTLISVYGKNYMIIEGYEKQLRNITIVASIIGFFLSFPLIYYWGFIGAAVNITLTRGILGISIMIKTKKLINKD